MTHEGTPATGTALEQREVDLIHPADVAQTQAAMRQYQEGTKALLDDSDYQDAGGDKRFVKKSGWRKIATWYGLTVEIVSTDIERGRAGEPLRAKTIARAIAPNGRIMDGDGYCAVTEFKDKRAGSVKVENDLRATATTRAKNRAIADLVGMGEVSAEEANAGPSDGKPEVASEALASKARGAIEWLVQCFEQGAHAAGVEPEELRKRIEGRITRKDGAVLALPARTLGFVIGDLKNMTPTPAGEAQEQAVDETVAEAKAQEQSGEPALEGEGEQAAGEAAEEVAEAEVVDEDERTEEEREADEDIPFD